MENGKEENGRWESPSSHFPEAFFFFTPFLYSCYS